MMKYQVRKEHYFRMYNKVFDLDLKATTFLVYLAGEGSFDSLSQANGISSTTLKRWVLQYRAQKEANFFCAGGNRHYSKEFKEKCVKAVLSGEGSVNDIVAKYNISDERKRQI